MFSKIFLLIIVLLIASLATDAQSDYWESSPSRAIVDAAMLYVAVLACIALINKFFFRRQRVEQQAALLFASTLLILFLLVFHFVLSAHRLYAASETMIAIMALSMYLLGLWIAVYASDRLKPFSLSRETAYESAMSHIRFLFPFVLPFLVYALVVDLVPWIPSPAFQTFIQSHQDTNLGSILLMIWSLSFLFLTTLLLPPLVVRIWKCEPLPSEELRQRLNALCHTAQFRHRGLLQWTIMKNAPTAAILGLLPRMRYVMFTEALLTELAPEEVEAILAHEIGHSYRRHLLVYPLIFLGMTVVAALVFLLIAPAINHFFILHQGILPSSLLRVLYPLAFFVAYAVIMLIYLRLVFGYFSRRFERQADLHVFHLGISPEVMESALYRLGVITGNTHKQPNWHHYSIQQRIDFLIAAQQYPYLVEKHHRRVRRSIIGYLVLLTLATGVVMAPLFPDLPLAKQITDIIEVAGNRISLWINGS